MNKSYAFDGTFAFLPTYRAKQKMQKSHQTNAPRYTNWTDNTTTEKKGEPLTATTKNWWFSG
jgi:hypothetical protein